MNNNDFLNCDLYDSCEKCKKWCDDFRVYMTNKGLEKLTCEGHVYKRGKGGAMREIR